MASNPSRYHCACRIDYGASHQRHSAPARSSEVPRSPASCLRRHLCPAHLTIVQYRDDGAGTGLGCSVIAWTPCSIGRPACCHGLSRSCGDPVACDGASRVWERAGTRLSRSGPKCSSMLTPLLFTMNHGGEWVYAATWVTGLLGITVRLWRLSARVRVVGLGAPASEGHAVVHAFRHGSSKGSRRNWCACTRHHVLHAGHEITEAMNAGSS